MMEQPETPEQLATLLGGAAAEKKTISLAGSGSKCAMAGPLQSADVTISTSGLSRVVQYDPKDLTISVEAGLRIAELAQVLAEHRLMLPLDPPFFDQATVGGIVASNCSGPWRRFYGTARDLIIGMKFITLDGKIIQSGGMVVKNVAGLDMAKLLVGSFGTLAAIAVVNFKVTPQPAARRTFLMAFEKVADAIAKRDVILQSVLQPAALDLLNPAAAQRVGREGYLLALQALGARSVMDRYAKELPGAVALEASEETEFWRGIREFVPDFLRAQHQGVVVRCSSTLSGLKGIIDSTKEPVLARAASGVSYLNFR